jgi:hypothetical protein
VDVYAACKEALNSTSGVQVVQLRAIAMPSLGRIDFKWVTQREYPFLGFNVYRAPDAGGSPGTFTQLNTGLIAPTGDPVLFSDDNRTPYVFPDTEPSLAVGSQYWYQVEWVDLGSVGHLEPPVPVAYGTLARVATAYYQIVHNAVDNDLLTRVGADLDMDPGTLGDADFEVLGPGQNQQDSSHVIIPAEASNTGSSTTGTIEHFWSVGFKQGDGAEPYLPPSQDHPWFLRVVDGGFVNRTGRVTAFSLFVNASPGNPGGTTYVTDHQPMPQPLVEGGVVPATLWIPEFGTTDAAVATFNGALMDDRVRLTLVMLTSEPGLRAEVYRSLSMDFETRQPLTAESIALEGPEFVYEDSAIEPGLLYHYWIAVRQLSSAVIWNGPVSLQAPLRPSLTFARAPFPNPVTRSATFEYAIGADAAGGGEADVSLTIHDLQGRTIKTLRNTREGAGVYRVQWNSTDERGARVPGGRYFLRLRAGAVTKNVSLSVVN